MDWVIKYLSIKLYFRVNVVQWSEDLYEEQLVERTVDACGGKVDIVIDFSATGRSIRRALKCLTPVCIFCQLNIYR